MSQEQLKSLPLSFFQNKTLTVAQELVGKVFAVRSEQQTIYTRILETEAYCAGDPASHCAAASKKRSYLMFQAGGIVYVYLIYGIHKMLNFVTEPKGCSGAVLIRSVEVLLSSPMYLNGPAKVCKFLGISLSDNHASLQGPRFYVYDAEKFFPIACSPRVGISKAKEKFWRFFIYQHPGVSPVKENQLAQRLL